MSIASRKQKDKEDKRALILDAAREIFLEKGYSQTSLRNIADHIDYSPGTIYLYFKDKDEIFAALHEEGFRQMLVSMQPLNFVSDPFERLKALGRVYLEFAKNNSDYYDLMFVIRSPLKNVTEHEKWVVGHQTMEYLKSVIRDCQQVGYFKDKDVDYISFIIWSGVHGMASLYCHDRCLAYEDITGDELLEKGFTYFAEMLEKL